MLQQCGLMLVAGGMMVVSSIGPSLATVSSPEQPFSNSSAPQVEQMTPKEQAFEIRRRRAVEDALKTGNMIKFYDNALPEEIAQYIDLPEATFQPAATGNLVSVHVSVSAKRMIVKGPGGEFYDWGVATGRGGRYTTPLTSGALITARDSMINHKSSISGGAMPFAQHWNGPYAVHGTDRPGSIGKAASNGCIRLRTENAKTLFYLVKRYGGGRIVVTR